jgi:hypothetical protein
MSKLRPKRLSSDIIYRIIRAGMIDTSFKWKNPGKSDIMVRNYGKGISNEKHNINFKVR